jgi:peptidoglycan/LPS O-acetylase OafA/YrhL
VVGREVNGTRTVASALGVCAGVSGLDHGFFEALQGNTATPGLIVQAIGPAQRMWIHGTEEALTLVPNFLATGILAMVLGMLTIVWSIWFIDRPNGSRVVLLLGGLMFLMGGGIGMLVFLLFGWAVARRIHRPLTSRQSVLPAGAGAVLSRAWPGFVAVGLALYAFALEVAIVGVVPGVSDPEQALLICWSALLAMLAALALALVGASVQDVAGAQAQHPAGASVARSR